MNRTSILIRFFLVCLVAMSYSESVFGSGGPVPGHVMERVYRTVKTPYKYGLVLTPETMNEKLDSPTLFRIKGRWYMTYVVYNGANTTDGTGYQTWLAGSDDLLRWHILGRILSFRPGSWDATQRGGYISLLDYRWGGSYSPQTYEGKYWMSYIGGSTPGYEAGRLGIGMACTDEPLSEHHEWTSFGSPVISSLDSDVGQWEQYTLYKSMVMRVPVRYFGSEFVMFYNAKGSSDGKESIGIALSDNLRTWRRYAKEPVFEHAQGITGDAQIQKIGNLFVMFYFGAFWQGKPYKAFNRFACSYDLVKWTDWTGSDLIVPSESYDNLFAHKSCVIYYKGIVYHFYCAVNDKDQRGIALATSSALGTSALSFPSQIEL